ncbi:hypothetical protein MTR67_048465 [Solanum verrucosum]|uniref:DUF4218 domain-containing protein n=1 Tax=Solanum verrucosum TaxID=315347 RepID=A0AAF0UZN0_SOLVR|nr:hypothetical protein MTR67_048465 [Solanum verrucosum]
MIDDLKHIEAQIPIILCKLEKIFSPSSFDVMVHLPVHLADEVQIGGPIHCRWMYPIELWLYFLKSLIGNRACLEGCIAKGYIANECMTLCSRYLHRIDTKFNRPERNDDGGFKKANGDLSIFCQSGKNLGDKNPFELEAKELEQAHIYILRNCDEVISYLEYGEFFYFTDRKFPYYFSTFGFFTGAIGKGRQQELTNVTMSSSHDKRVIHKKSMALEKGYMQVNASFHPSIKQVKQNIQEVETINSYKLRPYFLQIVTGKLYSNSSGLFSPVSTGKERGTGPKNSTMPSSEVHTPFHSFTNQVKQCTKEVETSAIERDVSKCIRSFCSSLGISEKNLESSRGLPSMDKNSFVLEKENTEIKSPGSTNQARSNRNAENQAKLKMFHHIGSKPIREIIYQQGGKDGNPPNLTTIFFETRRNDNMFVEPEAIEKHAQIEEILNVEPSLPSIQIVEKCCGPQNRSHVFDFGVE